MTAITREAVNRDFIVFILCYRFVVSCNHFAPSLLLFVASESSGFTRFIAARWGIPWKRFELFSREPERSGHLQIEHARGIKNETGKTAVAGKTGDITMKEDCNEELSRLLKQWQPRPIAAGEIRAKVWHRIEKEEDGVLAPWMWWLASWFERPAVVAGVVAVALGVGIAFGTTASAQDQTEAYLQSMVAFRH